MYKIQIRAIEKKGMPTPPENIKKWQDLVDMPELTSITAVWRWLSENDMSCVEHFGFQFRVIPNEAEGE